MLGIRQKADSVGFKDLNISPVFVDGLDFVTGYITLETGKLEVTIIKQADTAKVTVLVPDGVNVSLIDGDKTVKLNPGTNEYKYKV